MQRALWAVKACRVIPIIAPDENRYKENQGLGDSEMALWVTATKPKPEDLSSVLRIPMVEEQGKSQKLSSDLLIHMPSLHHYIPPTHAHTRVHTMHADTHAHIHTYTNVFQKVIQRFQHLLKSEPRPNPWSTAAVMGIELPKWLPSQSQVGNWNMVSSLFLMPTLQHGSIVPMGGSRTNHLVCPYYGW